MKNKLLWFPTRRCYLDASFVDAQSIVRFLHEIDRKKVQYLCGYCGSLEQLAEYLLRHKIDTIHLQMIWSTTSPLSSGTRVKIEQAFHCPVMDQYGSCETPNIGVQKRNENFLTVHSDYVHVDILTDKQQLSDEPDVPGDMLISDLTSFAFPFIKYRIGDRSSWALSPAESPDGFPRLNFVKGRISDLIRFPDGTYLDGAYLTTICDNYSQWIERYQLWQRSDFSVLFRILPKRGVRIDEPKILEVIDNLRKKTGGRLLLTPEFPDEIPDDRGKRRFIISELNR